ncbi:MAG: aminopeptidase [Candidatus Nanohaloarchaea archaeon]
MTLQEGAETIVKQCLQISTDETVVVPDDGNDPDIVQATVEAASKAGKSCERVKYDEPDEHGEEPPERVAKKMKEADVFIAPTNKSISHTDARREANENGARGATLPGINKEIWNSSLLADYERVKEISEKVHDILQETETIRITTPSGTELELDVEIDLFHTDTGLIHEEGGFGNLPAGEADGGALNARGELVVDHLPILDGAEGAVLEIEENKVVGIERSEQIAEKFEEIDGARNVAEFGFGTNPEAEIIGNVLNDEKVLGTVHVAFGDNSSYVEKGDPRRVNCPIHWDVVCMEPTVRFDESVVLRKGDPVFLDEV